MKYDVQSIPHVELSVSHCEQSDITTLMAPVSQRKTVNCFKYIIIILNYLFCNKCKISFQNFCCIN